MITLALFTGGPLDGLEQLLQDIPVDEDNALAMIDHNHSEERYLWYTHTPTCRIGPATLDDGSLIPVVEVHFARYAYPKDLVLLRKDELN
jgi:hypothetical protein